MCIKISHPWKHPLTSIKISHFGEVLPRLCIESLGRSIATSSSSAKSCELSCELSSGLRQVREDPWQLVKVYPQRASYFRGKTDDQPWDFGGWVPHFQTNPCVIQVGRSLHQPSFRVVSNIRRWFSCENQPPKKCRYDLSENTRTNNMTKKNVLHDLWNHGYLLGCFIVFHRPPQQPVDHPSHWVVRARVASGLVQQHGQLRNMICQTEGKQTENEATKPTKIWDAIDLTSQNASSALSPWWSISLGPIWKGHEDTSRWQWHALHMLNLVIPDWTIRRSTTRSLLHVDFHAVSPQSPVEQHSVSYPHTCWSIISLFWIITFWYILIYLGTSWYLNEFINIYISYYILVCLDTSPPSAGPELHWGIQSRKAVRPGWGGTTGSGEGSGATLIPSCSKQAQAFSPGAGKNDGAVRNFDVKTLKNWRSKECIDPKVFQWIL